MAIGTTAAILGSAVIGAGASAMAGSANSRAIRDGSAAQAQANREAIAAQERARAENLALQRPLYDAGMPAVSARNALLGLPGVQAAPAPASTTGTPTMPALPGRGIGSIIDGISPRTVSENQPAIPAQQVRPGVIARSGGVTARPDLAGDGRLPNMGQGAGPNADAMSDQEQAFNRFRESTGYRFRYNQGMNALNSGWAGAGTLQSGAAMQAAQEYGQNMASSEFGNYWNMLGEQQNLTSGAANAMAGVNTTYANNAGNLAIANGNNIANASVARANNNNAMWSGIGGSFGNALGYFAYRPGA